MTREEAIKRLKDARNTIQPFRYVDEAIDYTIKALEQESVLFVLNKVKEEIKDNTYFINETTEKEGIDFETVEKIIDKYATAKDKKTNDYGSFCEDWYDILSDEMTLEQARQAVRDLRKKPAKHLEQEPCEDAISRREAIKKFTYSWIEEKEYSHCLRCGRMTIDEAIKHCEEVAEQNEWFDKNCLKSMQCRECAEEYRQLAEWLEELKQLREQTSALDKVRVEIAAYGSIWVEYSIPGYTEHDIEVIVKNVLKQAKEQVLKVIDKYSEKK